MRIWRIILFITIFTAPGGFLVPQQTLAEATKVRVTAQEAIEKGDVAGAQAGAQTEALERAVEKVLGQIVPERTFETLLPLFEERIIPQTEHFISNYQIVDQDVNDRAYTVRLSVTVDTDLLRQNLVRIGVIKEPGSPPLGAVFVSVEAPLGLDHVKSLGAVAQKAVTQVLDGADLVMIPPAEEDGFRVVRPPQTPEALVSEGLVALADVAVGVLFRKNGDAQVTGSSMTIPMSLYVQVVDVHNGALVDVANLDARINMGTKDGTLLSTGLEKDIGEMASSMSENLSRHFLAAETKRTEVKLAFEGRHDAATVRQILNEVQFRLGETTDIIPVHFSFNRSVYTIWTPKNVEDIVRVLQKLENKRSDYKIFTQETGITLLMEDTVKHTGVLEFGEEVTFYRRLPVPGIENPDDIRKIEFVGWQEFENNSEPGSANAAPLGMGILGRIDPARDLDFYQFQLPAGANRVSVLVEQTGPGEVRSHVRVFSSGSLVEDQVAKGRGRNLYFTFPVSPGQADLQLSVEDFLGRYPSMFPYVLKVGVTGSDGGR